MTTQKELFPLPKKQATLFGKAKGTILGESLKQSQPPTSDPTKKHWLPPSERASEMEGNKNQPAGINPPPRHRCDPNNLLPRPWSRREPEPEQMLDELNDDTDDFIDEYHNEQAETEPSNDDVIEPPPIIEGFEPIQVLGPVAHVDPTHPNPYDHTQTLWQSIRRFFMQKFAR